MVGDFAVGNSLQLSAAGLSVFLMARRLWFASWGKYIKYMLRKLCWALSSTLTNQHHLLSKASLTRNTEDKVTCWSADEGAGAEPRGAPSALLQPRDSSRLVEVSVRGLSGCSATQDLRRPNAPSTASISPTSFQVCSIPTSCPWSLPGHPAWVGSQSLN